MMGDRLLKTCLQYRPRGRRGVGEKKIKAYSDIFLIIKLSNTVILDISTTE